MLLMTYLFEKNISKNKYIQLLKYICLYFLFYYFYTSNKIPTNVIFKNNANYNIEYRKFYFTFVFVYILLKIKYRIRKN